MTDEAVYRVAEGGQVVLRTTEFAEVVKWVVGHGGTCALKPKSAAVWEVTDGEQHVATVSKSER